MDHQQTQTCGIEMVYLIFSCFVDSEGSVLEVAVSALALSLDAAAAFCDFAACKYTVAFQRRFFMLVQDGISLPMQLSSCSQFRNCANICSA